MVFPQNFEQIIGFDVIRAEVNAHCISPLGTTHCEQMRFCLQPETIRQLLEETNEFVAILQSRRDFPINYYFDLRGALAAAQTPGSHLSADNLHRLQRLLQTIHDIRRFFDNNYPRLREIAETMDDLPEVASAIAAILDQNGNVKDNASPLLAELRSSIARLNAGIAGIMRRIIANGKSAGTLDADAQPTMRDGRLVLPVAPAHKRKVRGIVHDESASGKTVFIEPEEIVEANNNIRECEAEVAREIARILTEVTDRLRPHIDSLRQTLNSLGRIDFIRAKALVAQDVGAQMPSLENQPIAEWYGARHPALILSLRKLGKEVVAQNIVIDEQNRILVISGPNAGGKSVCLKTVGVVQYMTQCGMLPTVYDNSHVGIFTSILADIGDQQSIEDELSTYSSHLQNMKRFIQRADSNSLVLIDEMGSGTEPQIGGAMAQAILGEFAQNNVRGIVTTHYQNLKHFAEETDGLINAAMLYDRGKMQPLFQLQIGYPGSSFAIEIARQIGLPRQVVDKAEEIVGSDYVNMDRYLLDIVRDRRYWERKRSEVHAKEKRIDAAITDLEQRLAKLRTERNAILREAKNEAAQILRESNAQIERAIKEIRETQAEKAKTRQAREQLEAFKQRLQNQDEEDTKRLRKLQPPKTRKKQQKEESSSLKDNSSLKVGDHVTITGSQTVGTITAIDEKYALVTFGNIHTRIPTEQLTRTIRSETRVKQHSTSAPAADKMRARQLNFKPDIDVRGMRADEAVQAVTYFIDDAIQFSIPRVRILHGTGTGALREAIRQYLRTIPGVAHFADEHVQFGGAGITVVDLQ